jgi:two-component sensor histidine kinase
VVLYAPVIRGGEVRWVLAAAMGAEALQAALVEDGGDPAVLTLVVDENGLVLARSRSPEAQIGRPATPSMRDGLAGRPAGSFRALTLEGREVSATFQRSLLTGWSAVAALDRRELDALTRRTLWATVAAVVLSLTLAGVLAVFLLSHVVERRLSDERLLASRALGDLDARLLAKSQEALADQRRAATEREVLLREIYHRVKNNLQIVQSLLRLGSRDLRPEQREPFEGAVRRIGAMARVHTLLYNSPDMSSIDLKEYLEGLVRETADAFDAEVRGIRPVLEVESMRIPLDTAVPLAFIAVEFLTNAFRHGFPPGRGGTVTVRAAQEGEDGVLVVSDDGVGLGPEGRPAGGRRPMGLSIAARLVQQIGGTLETPGPGGSLYRVTFPLGENAPRVGQTPGPPIPPPPEAGARVPGAGPAP